MFALFPISLSLCRRRLTNAAKKQQEMAYCTIKSIWLFSELSCHGVECVHSTTHEVFLVYISGRLFSALDSFKNTYCQHVRPSISFLCLHKIFICLFYSLSDTPSWSEYKQQAQKKRPTGIPLSNYKLCGLCHIFFSFSLFPIAWSECSVIRLCGSFILHTFNNELKIKPFPWPIWNSISPIHSRNDSAHMSHFPLADARIWGKSILILIFIQEENEAINRANPPHFNKHNYSGFSSFF